MYTMSQEGNALVYRWDGEVLSVEPWGANSFRVRSTVLGELEDTDYALLPQEPVKAEIKVADGPKNVTSLFTTRMENCS